MKEYFLNLFEYDRFCNRLMFETTLSVGAPSKAVKLMAHILGAQQIWLNRCIGSANAYPVPVWPNWNADEVAPLVDTNFNSWAQFIKAGNLNANVTYKNTKGELFNIALTPILTHVINHGTHHRAQIGQLLKLAGMEELPSTDYIVWTRSRQIS